MTPYSPRKGRTAVRPPTPSPRAVGVVRPVQCGTRVRGCAVLARSKNSLFLVPWPIQGAPRRRTGKQWERRRGWSFGSLILFFAVENRQGLIIL